ncbi:MAG: ABC transporter permease [Candidatus Woesearchaeota archaeon]|nr:MAG: ABC transporter permease [Candidatus Woesearchaeota archaeon]
MIKQLLRMSLKSLKERSVRSWITIFGIVISIAVILILLSLSAGLQGAVEDLFDDFGRNRIIIMSSFDDPTSLGAQRLLEKDVEAVAKLPYFKAVIPFVAQGSQQVIFKGEERYISVSGIPNDDAELLDKEYKITENLVEGRTFRDNEERVAILGNNVAYDNDVYFTKQVHIRNSIIINGQKYTVIGIYKKYGTDDDNMIMIPMQEAQEMFGLVGEVSAIDAIVKDGYDMDQVETRLTKLLEKRKGEDNFLVMTPESIIKQFNSVMGIVQGILLGIAFISLVVGAIGIANTMFTSVLEREQEIGIMKSIGATNGNITTLFLFESGFIGTAGGVVGVIIGIGGTILIGAIAEASGFSLLKTSISPMHVAFCILFSFIIGMVSGAIPSYLGSKKRIIDTLRQD